MNFSKYFILALFCLNMIACGSSSEENNPENTTNNTNIENNKHIDDARILGKFLAKPNLEEILKTIPEARHESLKKNAKNAEITLEFKASGQINTFATMGEQQIEQNGIYTLKNNELTITYKGTKPQFATLQRTPNGFLMKNGDAHYILIRQ